MWDDAASQVEPELGGNERLLWCGRPRLGLLLRDTDAFLVPLSILWGGFAIYWETSAVMAGAPVFFVIWGIPFVLVGLYLIAGRFFADAQQRSRTYYGVTNERVLIISGLFRRSIKSLNIDTLTDVSLTEGADGFGTITLGPTSPWYGWTAGSSWPGAGQYATPAIELIEDARSVYDTIRAARREKLHLTIA